MHKESRPQKMTSLVFVAEHPPIISPHSKPWQSSLRDAVRRVFECRSAILRNSEAVCTLCLRSGWSPISRKRSSWNSAHGATGRTQTVPVLGSVRYAPEHRVGPGWFSCPGTPHEILLRNNGQEEIRSAEILNPGRFHYGGTAPPPGSRSTLRVQRLPRFF